LKSDKKSLNRRRMPLDMVLISWLVAQICNLLYRGFSIRKASAVQWAWRRAAECNSAIQQITNLRYLGRPQAQCPDAPNHRPTTASRFTFPATSRILSAE